MPKQLLNHPDIDSLGEEQRCRSMPAVMHPSVPHAGIREQGLPLPPVFSWVDWAAELVGEDEAMRGVCSLSHHSLQVLYFVVRLEAIDKFLRDRNGPLALSLGLLAN